MYHRVDRAVRDRWHLCVSPENFEAQLCSLRRNFTPVGLAELGERIQTNRLEHGMVAVTFDDGYRDNLTVAMPVLKKLGIPATFFIAGEGAVIGESFWWEVFDAFVQTTDMDETTATELHRRLMVASTSERVRMIAELPPRCSPLPARLSVSELKELACEPLVDIGAHGWSHRALAGLAEGEQRLEMTRNIEVVSDVTGRKVEAFAYPFGGPFTDETIHLLRELGIKVACAIGNEPITVASDLLALSRFEVRDWGIVEFEAALKSLLVT